MFSSNRNWLQQAISDISQKLSILGSELSALNQDVKNMHHEQTKHENRMERIEDRVVTLERQDVRDSSKWDGMQTVWFVVTAFLSVVATAGVFFAFIV
jgi:predicted nuclease with TOPRIM domain